MTKFEQTLLRGLTLELQTFRRISILTARDFMEWLSDKN
jgi:hypothetical protein